MGTTSQKIEYLAETKRQIKETINFAGGTLTNETFRQYPEKLYDKYLDILKDNGEELFNGLPKDLRSGTSISMNNTANTRMKMSLAPSELEQATTTGKNKFSSELERGFINTSGGNQTYGVGYRSKTHIEVESSTVYTISRATTAKNMNYVYFYDTNKTFISRTSNSEVNITFTTPANTKYIRWRSDTTDNIVPTYIQLELGSTASSFEPYTGGIASPNPDYPQDIHTISGDNEIDISTNLTLSATWNTGYLNASNLVVNDNTWNYSDYIDISGNTQYIVNGSENAPKTILYDSDKNVVATLDLVENQEYNLTTYNAKYIRISTPVGRISNQKLYTKQTLPLTLGTLEYCKISNYADEFYLATESDTSLVAGKWYLKKNIGKVVLDGSEEGWVYNSSGSWNFRYPTNIKENTSGSIVYDLYSNYYKAQPASGNNYALGQLSNNKAICFRNTDISTLADFKTWVSTHNTTVYYVLDASSYTLLNDTLQEQLTNIYNKALSYQDQTNISQVNDDLPFVISANVVQKYFLNDELE